MTSNPQARTFSGDFKRFFIRGLVVLLPSVLTLWIVVKAYQFVDTTIAEPINASIRTAMIQLSGTWEPLREAFDPSREQLDVELQNRRSAGIVNPNAARVRAELRAAAIRSWWGQRWYLDFIGIIVAIIAVYIAGRLLGGLIGRRLYRRLEDLLTKMPVFKQVYPYVKQIVDFLFSDDRPIKFNRVVVVEYPRKGIWSVGFMTGETMRSIAERAGDSVTVFVPSSPTPFTGYTITVPRNEVVEVPITVDQAIRFAVSGGVLVPEHQLIKADAEALPAGANQPAEPPPRRKRRKQAQAAAAEERSSDGR